MTAVAVSALQAVHRNRQEINKLSSFPQVDYATWGLINMS